MKHMIAAALAATLATFATASETITAGDLSIENPFVFETPKLAKAGGGFMTITNNGEETETLIGVTADFPKVEIHTTIMEDGRALMRPAGELSIAPGETLTLEPGGYHVMFMGLSDPFELGETVQATLVFEHAGEVDITFPVMERGQGMMHGHGNMQGNDS